MQTYFEIVLKMIPANPTFNKRQKQSTLYRNQTRPQDSPPHVHYCSSENWFVSQENVLFLRLQKTIRTLSLSTWIQLF